MKASQNCAENWIGWLQSNSYLQAKSWIMGQCLTQMSDVAHGPLKHYGIGTLTLARGHPPESRMSRDLQSYPSCITRAIIRKWRWNTSGDGYRYEEF
jgi:hypothetical protein